MRWVPAYMRRVWSTAPSAAPPGWSPDQLSWPMAVILPSCPAAMRTRWMVAGRCVVLLAISERCSATLTGRPAARAPSAASSASARRNSLPPKPPPMNGETRRTLSLECPASLPARPAPGNHLVRGPYRELVALPCGQRGMGLHHGVRLVWRGVCGVHLHGGRGEGAFEIANGRVRRIAIDAVGWHGGVLGLGQVVGASHGLVVHTDQLRGSARLLEGFRHHQGHGLVVVGHLGPASSGAVFILPWPSLPAVCAVTMASTPGARLACASPMLRMRPLAMAEPTT